MKILRRWFGILISYSLLSVNVFLSAQSPGGVSSSLNLWLKADAGTSSTTDGADVLTWTDQSANLYTGTTTFFLTKPSYANPGINFNPAIELDGVSAGFFLPNGSLTFWDDNYCIYAIIRSDPGSVMQAITNVGFSNQADVHMTYVNPDGSIGDGAMGSSYNNLSPAGTVSDDPAIVSFHYNTTANSSTNFANGIAVSTEINIPDKQGLNFPCLIGLTNDGFVFEDMFDGYIAEVIHYESIQSASDRQQIHSYLALKYGITLGSTVNLVDYVDSDGTTIWSGNASYQNGIGGIGRPEREVLL